MIADAKCTYPAACNSLDTILVHKETPLPVIKAVFRELAGRKGVSVHADESIYPLLSTFCEQEHQDEDEEEEDGDEKVTAAVLKNHLTQAAKDGSDFQREWLSMDCGMKQVATLAEAVIHINRFGSHHTDAIITENRSTAVAFVQAVDR